MNILSFMDLIKRYILSFFLKSIKTLPSVKSKIKKEHERVIKELEPLVKPYKGKLPVFNEIPDTGSEKNEVLKDMEKLGSMEESRWKSGFISGAVYHGEKDHIEFLNKIYAINSQSNPLHSDIWPSTVKYESEVVAMTAHMLGASIDDTKNGDIGGVVTSGGTESILSAMKTYRDRARVKKPEMIVPCTAHAAFDKAAYYFNIKIIHIPVDSDYRADIEAAKKAISKNTIVIVGSAPSFPHGIIDPIEPLSNIAAERGVGFHTDACLGGFVLPWAEKLGYVVPGFDFRLPGVTSISVDTHKYGYTPKGTSVLLYRGLDLRHHQYFKVTDWPGGLYFSPTFAGSRPGGLIAACWAAMRVMGKNGYMEVTRKILKTAEEIKKGIREIPELYILGEPLWNIAFSSKTLNIYRVMDNMSGKGWSLNGLHMPQSIHICLTLRHTQEGVAQRFISDLNSAVEYVKKNPDTKGGMAPIYGMAASIPDRSIVEDLLDAYMDLLYETE